MDGGLRNQTPALNPKTSDFMTDQSIVNHSSINL
jgi:hypothetical protein